MNEKKTSHTHPYRYVVAGMRVLVAGGTGTVGSGVVMALLRQGVHVTVATRSVEKFVVLQKAAPEDFKDNLSVAWGDVSTEKGARNVFDSATRMDGGDLNHVVASIGSWWQKGRLIDQSLLEFNDNLRERVAGHFLLLRAFLPYLNNIKGSSYNLLTCSAATEYLAPYTSLFCVGSGALKGLALAARTEYRDMHVAINEFNIGCQVHALPDRSFKPDDPNNIGNDLMGAAIVAAIGSGSHGKTVIDHRQDARALAYPDK